jgi:hypothetical protein
MTTRSAAIISTSSSSLPPLPSPPPPPHPFSPPLLVQISSPFLLLCNPQRKGCVKKKETQKSVCANCHSETLVRSFQIWASCAKKKKIKRKNRKIEKKETKEKGEKKKGKCFHICSLAASLFLI